MGDFSAFQSLGVPWPWTPLLPTVDPPESSPLDAAPARGRGPVPDKPPSTLVTVRIRKFHAYPVTAPHPTHARAPALSAIATQGERQHQHQRLSLARIANSHTERLAIFPDAVSIIASGSLGFGGRSAIRGRHGGAGHAGALVAELATTAGPGHVVVLVVLRRSELRRAEGEAGCAQCGPMLRRGQVRRVFFPGGVSGRRRPPGGREQAGRVGCDQRWLRCCRGPVRRWRTTSRAC
jgi:hypothetical protein